MGTVRPPTVEQAVVAELRQMILRGQLPPGSAIQVGEIAAKFKVSRVPIRDALRILEGEGLVHTKPHRGYDVARLDAGELREIQDLRGILEREALELAVANISDQMVEEMATRLDELLQLEREGDLGSWVGVHRRFHFILFEASRSDPLLRLLHQLWNSSDLYRAQYMRTGRGRSTSDDQHRDLLKATRARDLNELLSIMELHRESTLKTLEKSLPPD